MKNVLTAFAATLTLAAPAMAEGDAAKGEKEFKKCRACHSIVDDAGEAIVKGGKTGPNLYGVVGRVAGSEEFKYGGGLADAAAAEFVWTEEALAAYTMDAKKWLTDNGYSSQTKMTFKLKKGSEDVAAYLASVAE